MLCLVNFVFPKYTSVRKKIGLDFDYSTIFSIQIILHNKHEISVLLYVYYFTFKVTGEYNKEIIIQSYNSSS